MSHSHSHHGFKKTLPAIRRSMLILSLFLVVELIGAKLSNSLALLGDALHLFSDVLSLSLSYWAAWIGARSHRASQVNRARLAEVVGTSVGSLLILGVTIEMVHEAWERFQAPEAVDSPLMLGVALAAIGVNFWSLKVMHGAKSESLNARAAYLHVLGDLLSSVAAAFAAAVMWATDWRWVDPAVTCLFALFIGSSSLVLLRDTLRFWRRKTPNAG